MFKIIYVLIFWILCLDKFLVHPDNFELLILHDNDQHARFEETDRYSGPCRPEKPCYGGFARVASVVREARRKEPVVLYLNAGDTYQGTPFYTLFKWNVTSAFLNALKPDAMSLGNHEFDDGVRGLIPFLQNSQFPVLACNLNLKAEKIIENDAHLIKPYVIIEKSGRKIGIIGYVTPETRYLTPPNNVVFLDEVKAINREARNLVKQGVNILIALGHSGYLTDQIIARDVPDIDLVVGGHTNTFLWNGEPPCIEKPDGPYPTIVQQKSNKKVPVVQAYAYTKYMGQLRLTFDERGDLVDYSGQPKLISGDVPQEQDVLSIIDRYRPEVLKSRNRIIGISSVFLDGSTCRRTECPLGNVLSDSMVFAYNERFKKSPAIAILNGGAVRASIDGGYVSMEDLMTVLPFGNDLVVGRYSGKVIKSVLEHGVRRHAANSTYGEFPQMSGIRVVYDTSRESGDRVDSVQVLCEIPRECGRDAYRDLDPNQIYSVVLNFFLSRGGDGYEMLRDKALSMKNIGVDDLKAAETYFRTRSPVWHGMSGRISFASDSAAGMFAGIRKFVFVEILIVKTLM